MYHPNQFQVNEVWIAMRVNDSFIYVQNEPYDIYMLVDAASCYAMAHVFSKVADEAPNERDVEGLFHNAWSLKKQWPKKLLVPEGDLATDVFRVQAEKSNIEFNTVRLSDIESIVGELKESFETEFLKSFK